MTKPTIRQFGQALQPLDAPAPDMAVRIRSRFSELGDVRLEIAEREPARGVAFDEALAIPPSPSIRRDPPPTRSR
jgi:hypothetical protein